MKRRWISEEIEEAWTLGPDELAVLGSKRGSTRLGFAVLTRFFARQGRFPVPEEIDEDAVECLAVQVNVPAAEYRNYDHRGRTAEYHRAQIRESFGFRPATTGDADELAAWLLEVAPYEYGAERLKEAAYTRLRSLKIEPPTTGRVDRLVRSTLRSYDERFCKTTLGASLREQCGRDGGAAFRSRRNRRCGKRLCRGRDTGDPADTGTAT